MNVNRFADFNLKSNDTDRLLEACATCTPQQLEAVDFYGNTALLKACYLGNLEAVQVLLSFNVNLHAINYFGQNALTLAAYAGSLGVVCELLKYRSYTDFTLSSMIPPICVAVLKGHKNLMAFFENMHPMSFRSVHGLTVGDLHNMQEENMGQNGYCNIFENVFK
ncbi:DNA replication inhibitor plutonium [Episyrphus balteatus]|uniref:DNA replication inhibitor plutonium n=1 Tax=Episyrphus balteatus TaxID=286459 RepID=UPI002485CF2C|nr:DNA replication inhibitor plutonium [Episyrphus balteatus]